MFVTFWPRWLEFCGLDYSKEGTDKVPQSLQSNDEDHRPLAILVKIL